MTKKKKQVITITFIKIKLDLALKGLFLKFGRKIFKTEETNDIINTHFRH